MKTLILLTLNTVLFSWGAMAFATESAQPTAASDSVRAELEELRTTVAKQAKQIQQLQKELAEQKRRTQEVEAVCQQHGIDPTRPVKSTQPEAGKYTYRGQVRSRAWFERHYRILCDKIVCIDGKYIDITKIGQISPNPPKQQGNICLSPSSNSKILQVLSPGEALIELRMAGHRMGIFHATGLSEQAVDDTLFANYTTVRIPDKRQ